MKKKKSSKYRSSGESKIKDLVSNFQFLFVELVKCYVVSMSLIQSGICTIEASVDKIFRTALFFSLFDSWFVLKRLLLWFLLKVHNGKKNKTFPRLILSCSLKHDKFWLSKSAVAFWKSSNNSINNSIILLLYWFLFF